MSHQFDSPKQKGTISFNLQKAFNDDENDQIIIQLSSNVIRVDYFQLCKYSKYIRNKYKQNDLKDQLTSDIQQFQKEYGFKEENIVVFFKLLQDENVEINNDQYIDLCILSNLFKVKSLINLLKTYYEGHINDVDFIIPIIIDQEKYSKMHDIFSESEEIDQLVNHLIRNADQCIKNQNFSKLPFSLVSKIIEKSDESKLNADYLYDFITDSIEERYHLFSLLNIKQLSDNKFDDLYKKYISSKNTKSEQYYQYLKVDLIYVKELKDSIIYETDKEKIKKQISVRKKDIENQKLQSEKEVYSDILYNIIKDTSINLNKIKIQGILNIFSNKTLLQCACEIGDLDIVRYLINVRKVNPKQRGILIFFSIIF